MHSSTYILQNHEYDAMYDVPGLDFHRSRTRTNQRLASTSPISPINRVPSSFASDHLPDPSFGGMADSPSTTTGNSRIVGVGKFDIDDDDVTFSWRRSFCVVLSSLPLVSQLGTVRLAEAIYSQRDVERGKNGVQEYRGLTHAVESSGSYAGPAARHMFVRLHEVPWTRQNRILTENRNGFRRIFFTNILFRQNATIFRLNLKEIKQIPNLRLVKIINLICDQTTLISFLNFIYSCRVHHRSIYDAKKNIHNLLDDSSQQIKSIRIYHNFFSVYVTELIIYTMYNYINNY